MTYLKNLRSGRSKLARASVQLSQCKLRVKHLAGKKNSAADAISRTEDIPTDPLTALATDRHEDDNINDLRLDATDGPNVWNPDDSRPKLSCDIGVQCSMDTVLIPNDELILNHNCRLRGNARTCKNGVACRPRHARHATR